MKPLAQNTLIQNRYLIVHLIGKGGMGEVYLAVDQRLGSAVALKRTFFAGDEMLGNAFEREARTLARMRHPVLPKVSDHFSENDEQYLVMEHISGDDLAKRLEAAGKPFPVSWVLFWADQLLDALSYLHTHEPPIIHRDIKPQNLKLTDENHVILLDFGLSKTSTGQTNISQSGSTGSVVGYTPHYAPMEQIRGIGTSPRSDLYSLSATLYQLLTNHVPVDALSRADSMLNELPDPIQPPHELNPEIPKVVSDVLLRGMEVSQEKRFANAREMQRVLRKAYSEIQQATTANTVAFTAQEAEAALNVPAASGSYSHPADSNPSPNSSTDPGQPEAPAIEPDSSIDLDATMAYNSSPADSGLKQSSVKTEVFLHGSNSLPPGASVPPSAGPSSVEPAGRGAESSSVSEVPPGIGDATVPFMDLGDADKGVDVPSEGTEMPQEPVFFDDEREPGPGSGHGSFVEPSETDQEAVAASTYVPGTAAAAAVSADYSSRTAPVPASKGGTGKTLAIVGGLAFLLLLGVAAAAGIWAYVNYSGSSTDVDPTPLPTPQETVIATPSPEPTVEMGVNSDSDTTNSNTNVTSANENTNSDLLVEPTPEPSNGGSDSPTSNGRPNPRSGSTPRPTTPRPPREQPPKRTTPDSRPRVLP